MDALLWQDKALSLLDQSKYPHEEVWYDCNKLDAVLEALRIPGAVCGEAILASAGAYAYCLAALEHEGSHEFYKQLSLAKTALLETRPSSASLAAALSRMEKAYEEYKLSDQLITALLATAVTIHRQDVVACRTMSREGREILPDEAKIVLCCRGGVFHTGAPGGPIGLLRSARMKQKDLEVFVCEHRPSGDGFAVARELAAAKIPVHVIPDHSAAALMPRRSCDMVLIEGLRAAKNGDLLAWPGAYELAIAAYFHSIPVYATLYTEDYDARSLNGEAFPQEDLSPAELGGFAKGSLPDGVSLWSPRYDVVLHQLLTGLITDKGLIFPPFEETISEALTKAMNKPLLTL